MSALHVEVIGSGPPLVLLHGWAMHGGVFAPLVERLRGQRTLHIVDLPGHGRSRECMLPLQLDGCTRAILDAVPDAPWCGWSLGGLLALHAAAIQPERVPALVMLCATPTFVASDHWPQGMPADSFSDFAKGLRDDWRGTLQRFIALEAFGSDHASEELRTLQQALFARGEPATRALDEGLALLEGSDLRDLLPTLVVPSLWVAGRRDRLVSPQAVQRAAGATPEARLVRIEHAGHAPFLTHAGAVVDAMLPFLDELQA